MNSPVDVKILVLNAGSSSLKSCLFSAHSQNQASLTDEPVWQAQIDFAASGKSQLKVQANGKKIEKALPESDFDSASQTLMDALTGGEQPVLASLSEISAVGHRVVHGGEKYTKTTEVTEQVLSDLSGLIELAPSHEPANIRGIEFTAKHCPKALQIAVFDTAFHSSMPESAVVYPCPFDWYEKLGIRRFGFHGINHQYCAQRAAEILNQEAQSLRMITCHLGNGASLCAIKGGTSQMTTMGYTPLEGLVMGTRCGSIDPGILLHLLAHNIYSAKDLDHALNKESGLKGISGETSDMREIQRLAETGHKRAQLALDIYIDRLAAQIAALVPALGGLDAIIFTGGVGQNSGTVRAAACDRLRFLGVEIDRKKNDSVPDQDCDVSSVSAKVKTLVIQAKEELAIARECLNFLASRIAK